MCECVSTSPGMTTWPARSIVCGRGLEVFARGDDANDSAAFDQERGPFERLRLARLAGPDRGLGVGRGRWLLGRGVGGLARSRSAGEQGQGE